MGAGVYQPPKGEDKIVRRHRRNPLPIVGGPIGIPAQIEGPGPLVLGNVPPSGHAWDDRSVRGDAGQTLHAVLQQDFRFVGIRQLWVQLGRIRLQRIVEQLAGSGILRATGKRTCNKQCKQKAEKCSHQLLLVKNNRYYTGYWGICRKYVVFTVRPHLVPARRRVPCQRHS